MMRYTPARPERVGVGYGLLIGAQIGSLLCAGIASMGGYDRSYMAAWLTLALLAALCLACGNHARWLRHGWPIALALAAIALALTGHPAAIICGATGVAALTAGCAAIHPSTTH